MSLPNIDLRKVKLLPEENFSCPMCTNENHAKKMANFRRNWVKEPRHSETIQDEKRYLHRSTSLSFTEIRENIIQDKYFGSSNLLLYRSH